MTDIKLDMETFEDFLNVISNFINVECVDPLSDGGNSRGSGTFLSSTNDQNLTKNFPKITFEMIDPGSRTRLTMKQARRYFRKQKHFEIGIIYTCGLKQKWVFEGTDYVGKSQCVRYLDYLADQLDTNANRETYFANFNELSVGDISEPKPVNNGANYAALMIVQADTYGRTG